MKIVYTFCLAVMVLVFSACGNPSPNTPTQPKVEAKNPPLLAGTWSQDLSTMQACGGSLNLGVMFELKQTQGQSNVTGVVTLIFSDGAPTGNFTGQVDDTGALTGVAIFKGSKQDYPFDIAVNLKDSKLQGKMTDRTSVNCNSGGLDKIVYTVALDKEDALEPNNTAAQASALEFEKEYSLTTKLGDADWFTFTLSTIHIVTFSSSNTSNNPNAVVYELLNQNQEIMDSFSSSQKFERVLLPGKYYLTAGGSNSKVNYTLKAAGIEVIDAKYEPNDTPQKATQLGSSFTGSFYLYQTGYGETDTDIFTFTLTEESVVTVDLGNIKGVNYHLFSNTNQIGTYEESYQGKFTRGLSAGTYYLSLALNYDTYQLDYALNFNTKPIPDKSYEPNNSLNAATLLTVPANQEFYLAMDDEDWFTFTLTDEQVVTFALVTLENRNFLPEMVLYSSQGQEMTRVGFGSSGSVAQFLSSGDYYLQVVNPYEFDREAMVYTLSIEKEALPDAALEPNNTLAQATAINLGFDQILFVNKTDKDYFKLTLDKTTQLDLVVAQLTAGNLSGRVMDASGNTEAYLNSNSNTVILGTGEHYFEFYPYIMDMKYQVKVNKK